jgi:hypothetical protein
VDTKSIGKDLVMFIIHNSHSMAFYVNHAMIHVLGTSFVSVAGMQ